MVVSDLTLQNPRLGFSRVIEIVLVGAGPACGPDGVRELLSEDFRMPTVVTWMSNGDILVSTGRAESRLLRIKLGETAHSNSSPRVIRVSSRHPAISWRAYLPWVHEWAMTAELDSLFERFRRSGEPDDLAQVFDACAYDLLKVAMHLCPSDGEAEDLVQETFLAAIKSASRYRSGEPVRAWLLGILNNRAHELRKRVRREPQPERMTSPSTPTPVDLLARSEFRRSFDLAIAGIPMPYREVIELRLQSDLHPTEIAHRLQRSPGTVRTQIYRAMEMLRAVLPKALAIACTTHLSIRGMSAVRSRIVEQAGTLSITTTVFGGLLVMKSLTLAGAVALIASLWFAWPGSEAIDPIAADSLVRIEDSSTSGKRKIELSAGTNVGERAPVVPMASPDKEPVVIDLDAPVFVSPFSVTVTAVDLEGARVEDAIVEVYAARRVRMRGAQGVELQASEADPEASSGEFGAASVNSYSGRVPGKKALKKLRTDLRGQCTFVIDRELCIVVVHKKGVGESGDWALSVGRPERQIVLKPLTHVTGVVLDADGVPAPGALIRITLQGGSVGMRKPSPKGLRSDQAGRFEARLDGGGAYNIDAYLDGKRSDSEYVLTKFDAEPQTITLQLPGAYTIRGLVLMPTGGPVTDGFIRVLPQGPERHWLEGQRRIHGKVENGQFSVPLTMPGKYLVVAGSKQHKNAKPELVTVGVNQARIDLTMHLTQGATMTGRVADADGKPVAGLSIQINREVTGMTSWANDKAVQAQTDEQGWFRVDDTHPMARYCLLIRPNREYPNLRQFDRHIRGDASDHELVLDAKMVNPTSVIGRVVEEGSGQAISSYEILLYQHQEGYTSERRCRVDDPSGEFLIGGLVEGSVYSLVIQPEGRPPTTVPKWTAAQKALRLAFEYPALAHVQCTVRRPDGSPAAGVLVRLRSADDLLGTQRSRSARSDEDGYVAFDAIPGGYKLGVILPRGPKPSVQQFDLVSGESLARTVMLKSEK